MQATLSQGAVYNDRYFKEILVAFSSAPIYPAYVCLSTEDNPTPPEILPNPKFYLFFSNTLGAIDGTHIEKSHKTAWHAALSICVSFMYWWAGRVLHMMPHSLTMHTGTTCALQKGSII
ncbi:hypothetical protein SERLADRAFT_438992 [Serpula lacrymans var. lacrymans S7.9]|uniref:Uncharacterized protein n=1 Tax=Serpula lacrymans var. lacrymans (strain S7.9) TaxID=578457 RepID=F8NYK9_SERL9|nr:uncharacterized protein SERLADRAFT_438992 [Serpula lacrymans var. lacrymans S7.9]EGO23680.1 hypothetical protein SERLADRAFT_438992 [Serpula lacrymans var. lacrymans S7.9]